MASLTELKLLTLLNVSAVKHPRPLDIPGGHRGSPTISRNQSPSSKRLTSDNKEGSDGNGVNGDDSARKAKRRKSVVFGGEVGPSGSSFANGTGKGKQSQDKTKGKKKSVDINAAQVPNGHTSGNGNAHLASEKSHGAVNGHVTIAEHDSEEEGESSNSGMYNVSSRTVRIDPVIGNSDMFNIHFGLEPPVLTPARVNAANSNEWSSKKIGFEGFGRGVELQIGAMSQEGESSVASRTRVSYM
jgi:U3 small nucleolar RNA-associated protein 25